jgi:adenylate cyclase
MAKFATPEDEWRAYLDGSHPSIRWGRRTFRRIPSDPRCRVCFAPFAGPGGAMFRRMGFVRWNKNPNVCMRCVKDMRMYDVMGAEVEISFLFADVRHSSEIARQMGTMEFTFLMQRFYATANRVLIDNDALIDKFVGDEVVGFFMPFLAGPRHAGAAVRAAQALLLATGYGGAGEPWLPLGAGVNTGTSFVGMVSSGQESEFTAFGDPINVAAHLAAQAGPGEILVTDAAATAASLDVGALERRHLSLKGHQADVVVVPVSPEAVVDGDGSARR